MRVSAADGASTILTYCTNVHPIEELSEALAGLGRWCRPVRERLGAETLALGLWLSRRSSRSLADEADARRRLRDALGENGLELVTLNGFPYGDFHAERVKEDVYRPDWSDVARYDYTLDLARILSECLPGDVGEGTISTLPLGYAPADRKAFVEECATRLAHLAIDLDRLAQRTGTAVRVCLEPEPGCVLETSEEAVAFFTQWLRPAATRRGVSGEVLERHLGLCFDACHQAVQYEEAPASWRAITDAGVRIGKVQLSCALRLPAALGGEAARRLGPFDEPRFLHQVRRRSRDGRLRSWMDLGPALGEKGCEGEETRVHFHAPLDWAPAEDELGTTVESLGGLAAVIAGARPLPHLEVETYTWTVLPESLRPRDDAGLIEGIAREIRFAEGLFAPLGIRRHV